MDDISKLAGTRPGSAVAGGDSLCLRGRCPALRLTPRGVILQANPAAADLLGGAAADLRGVLLWSLAAARELGWEPGVLQRFAALRAPVRLEGGRNGAIYETCWTPELDEGGELESVILVAWDVTARTQAEASAREAARLGDRLRQSTRALQAAADLEGVLAGFLTEAVDLAGAQGGGFYALEEGEAVLRHRCGSGGEVLRSAARLPLGGELAAAVLSSTEAMADVTEPGFGPDGPLAEGGGKRAHSVVLRNEGRASGFLLLLAAADEPLSAATRMAVWNLAQEAEAVARRVSSEERYRRINDGYRVILDTVPHGIAYARGRKVVWANPAHDALLGYEPGGSVGVAVADHIVAPEEYERVGRETAEPFARGWVYSTEVEVRRKGGQGAWFKLTGRPLDPGRFDEGAIWIVDDITERKAAEQCSANSLALLEGILESTADGILLADGRGRMVKFNRKFLEMWRLPAEVAASNDDNAALQFTLDQLTDPDGFLQTVQRLYARPELSQVDTVKFKDGRVFERYSKSCPLGGDVLGRVWSFRDITERRMAEERLAESEERHRAVLAGMAEAVTVCDADGRLLELNPAAEALFGFRRERVLGRSGVRPEWPLSQADGSELAPEDHPGSLSLRTGKPCHGRTLVVRRADGTPVWLNVNAQPLFRSGQASPYAAVTSFTDITQRKLMENALRESEERFARMFDASPAASILTRSDDGAITDVNHAFLSMFGYTAAEVLGRTALQIGLWHDLARREQMLEQISRFGRVSGFEAKCRRKSGEVGDALLWVESVEFGGVPCLFAMLVDVTERNRLEERLRQVQKMEGIGHLAGGMAHEFNNILAGMMMSLSLAQMRALPAEAAELMQGMDASCRRAADLVKQLLAFSRRSMMQRTRLDLTSTVADQLKMLARFLGERITLRFTHPAAATPVEADRALIEQVLLNLCLNARDAMPEGGVVTLDLAEVEIREPDLSVHPRGRAGRHLRLSVADTGTGMDERTLSRLFEPFFTTKEVGKGTGLGLATVHGIIEQHNGWVEVESEVGKGSCFRVYIPAASGSTSSPQPAETELHGVQGTILIVEDEPGVRLLTRRLLAQNGHRLFEASDAQEALAIWAAHKEEIHLVYTDLIMPGTMSGLQLAQRLLADKPGLTVIITSGYHPEALDIERTAPASIQYLPKPCPPAVLLAVIARSLQSSLAAGKVVPTVQRNKVAE